MPFDVGGNVISTTDIAYFNDKNIIRGGLLTYLDAGIVGSYPGSGTTWTDLSGNGYNGTLTNGPTFSTANGGYLAFDGSDDYVDLGNQSALGFTSGVFTVEAWIYIPSSWTGGSQYPNVVSKGAGAGWDQNGWSLFCFRGWNGPYAWGYGARNGGTTNIVSRNSCPSNTYLHTVITANGSTIVLYENGVQQVSASQTINPASNSYSVWIARDFVYGIAFPGRVSGVKLYNVALSAAQVIQNFNANRRRYNV
jgi:hypothetical protein